MTTDLLSEKIVAPLDKRIAEVKEEIRRLEAARTILARPTSPHEHQRKSPAGQAAKSRTAANARSAKRNRRQEPRAWNDEFLTVTEVAQSRKVTEQTVRNWINAGKLPALRLGRRVRIRRSDFDQVAEQGKIEVRRTPPQLAKPRKNALERANAKNAAPYIEGDR